MPTTFARAMLCLLFTAAVVSGQVVEVTNNHDFPIAMPWRLRDGRVIEVNVGANGKQRIEQPARAATVKLEGTLEWDVVVEKIDKSPSDAEAAGNKRDFTGTFVPIAMRGDDKAIEGSKHGLKLRIEFD